MYGTYSAIGLAADNYDLVLRSPQLTLLHTEIRLRVMPDLHPQTYFI